MLDRALCLFLGSPRFRKFLVVLVALFLISWSSDRWDSATPQVSAPKLSDSQQRKLKSEQDRLKSSLDRISPAGPHILIDTARNRLYLKQGKAVLLEAVCSTGNGKVLFDHDKDRRWVFDTPRGQRQIVKKVHDPKWVKPDWAFIEEGEQIPTSVSERVEEEMLGKYALHIGDGFMIHGTLYRRLLGRSVTHGCIRLGDADLKKVFETSPVGTPVFIY